MNAPYYPATSSGGDLPYPEVPYTIVHTGDLLLLLGFGCAYELFVRLYQRGRGRPTAREVRTTVRLAALHREAARKRALGPSAFVETSKLERLALGVGKEAEALEREREVRTARAAGRVTRWNRACNVLIVGAYWGVAMVAIDGAGLVDAAPSEPFDAMDVVAPHDRAAQFWKGLFFPLSYNAFSYKIAQFGIDSDLRPSCLGALAVVWAARVTCGEVVACAFKWCDLR